jgi:hypothetical protein
LSLPSNAIGTDGRLTQKQIWALRLFLYREERLPGRALSDLVIDSKLGGWNLEKLTKGDLVAGSDIRTRALVEWQMT